MKFCPQCGTTFEPEARFCLECGFDRSVVEPFGPEVTTSPGVTVTETNTMPEAPAEVPHSQPEDKSGCPQCGISLDKSDRFCQECGFDTLKAETLVFEGSQTVQPQVEDEITIPLSPNEELVSPTDTKHFCPQCSSGIEPGERFCQECGFDNSALITSNAIKPEPVVIPPVAPPPASKSVFTPSTPESDRNPSAAYTQTERSGKPAVQQKGKKTILWIVLAVVVLGVLGAAGWFGYKWYLASPEETFADTVITMGIPEDTEIATDAINDEAAEQPEPVTAKQPEAKTKPLSRIDQELAKQKTKAKNQPAQQTTDDQPAAETPIATDNDIIPKVLLEVGRKEDPKHKNPKNPTKLTLQKPTMIVKITTDHYNNGMGTPRGGTITIKDGNDNTIGSYKALGKTGKNGTPSAKWVAMPNIMLEKGTYFIWDSDMATWSKTFIGNNGFIVVEGYTVE